MGEIKKLLDLYGACDIMFEEENFRAYRLGGFHPVTLGDSMKDGQYEIRHKLGYGGFATVWLARDHKYKRWVSVKIMRVDRADQSQELQNLQELAQRLPEHPGSKHIVRLLDHFVHRGPNGNHQCLVFELLGPTVALEIQALPDDQERLHRNTIIKVCTQILEAVDFMHKAGFAHGDLSLRNVVFRNRRLPYISKEELFDALGPPEPDRLERLDGEPLGQGIPIQLVASARWTGWPLDDDELDDDDIRIIDLGSAFHQDTPPQGLAQVLELKPPEIIFTGKFDHRQDLWCVGLTIYHLIFGTLPYTHWKEISIVRAMINVFGDLPPEWEPKWEKMRADAAAEGSRADARWVPHTDFRVEKRFDREIHDPELKGLLPVIQGLTKFKPEDRISASQAVRLLKRNYGDRRP